MDRNTYAALKLAYGALIDQDASALLAARTAVAKVLQTTDVVTDDTLGTTACAWCDAPTRTGAYVCPEHAPPVRELAGAPAQHAPLPEWLTYQLPGVRP